MAVSDLRALNAETPARRRVALLIHSLQGGGAERVMSQLANRWSAHHEVHLITWSKADADRYPLDPSVVRTGLDLQVASSGLMGGLLANVQRVRRLRSTLRRVNPDLVLSFCDQMNIVAMEAMRSLPQIPIWIAEHSDPEKQRLSSLWEAWRRRNYPRCTGCIALTESIAQFMAQWVPMERLRVIPAVMQTDPSVVPAYQVTSKLGPNSILFVGRLSQEKRVDLLLAAWQRIEPQLANWQLLIAGDGPIRKDLEQAASRFKRVKFLGWLDSPAQVLATSQLFVLCSRYEGFPVALLEAMYQGLPAVATNCSSAIEQLHVVTPRLEQETGESNVVESLKRVSVDSVEELSQAIIELAEAPLRRQHMSQAAHEVAKNFTWEAIGPKWDRVLQGK